MQLLFRRLAGCPIARRSSLTLVIDISTLVSIAMITILLLIGRKHSLGVGKIRSIDSPHRSEIFSWSPLQPPESWPPSHTAWQASSAGS
jgi:hypothetical protein